jgi:hypothetical protein
MAMFLDILFALLAMGTAAVWILTARGELPPDWDPLRRMPVSHGGPRINVRRAWLLNFSQALLKAIKLRTNLRKQDVL